MSPRCPSAGRFIDMRHAKFCIFTNLQNSARYTNLQSSADSEKACPQKPPSNVVLGTISTPRQAELYVRKAREERAITRTQLALASGVSERLLASLELGDATGIRLDKLLAVCKALGISLTAALEQHSGPADARGSNQSPTSSFTYDDLLAQIAFGQGLSISSKTEG